MRVALSAQALAAVDSPRSSAHRIVLSGAQRAHARSMSTQRAIRVGFFLLSCISASAVKSVDTVASNGASECPCITALSASQAEGLAARGFPPSYGLQGCHAYDADLQNVQAKIASGCTVRTYVLRWRGGGLAICWVCDTVHAFACPRQLDDGRQCHVRSNTRR